MKLKQLIGMMGLLYASLMASTAIAAEEHYNIDIKGQHAFIQFKLKHLGYSWMLGEFRTFDGSFIYDEQYPENNKVSVTIQVNSIDTNHAERNKHLRSADFFDVKSYPTITFVSSWYEDIGKNEGVVHGILNLHGVSKNIDIHIKQVGAGKDPWGGYRRGFEGRATLHLSDYKMRFASKLGPVSDEVALFLSIEGVRQ